MSNNLQSNLQRVTRTSDFFLMVGKGRVKEPVEQGLRHPKAYLLQVNGMKAISHSPDRDRVLPIVPEGTRKREGCRQQERKEEGGSRRELKTGDKEREQKPETLKERWMDNGKHSSQRMTMACFDLNACFSLFMATEGKLERQHFVFVC